MTDLISRSAALKDAESIDWYHINQNGRLVSGSTSDDVSYVKFDDVISMLKNAPAVDAVHVVRCRDCKLFMPYTEAYRKASGFDGDCAFLAGYADCDRECVHEMDFCSKGERMDGDEDAAD